MWQHILHQVLFVYLANILDGIVSHHVCIESLCDFSLYTIESPATDKEDVTGIDVDIFLVGMFPTTLWWNIDHGALQQLEQTLLYALTTHIACDRRVVAFPGDFVNFIYKDNTSLCSLHLIVGHLQKP